MTPACGDRPCEGQIQASSSTAAALVPSAAAQVSWGLGIMDGCPPRADSLVGEVAVKQTQENFSICSSVPNLSLISLDLCFSDFCMYCLAFALG